MNYQVYYVTKWLKDVHFCGEFTTLEQANDHIDYLQNKLPNGRKITFIAAR